MIGKVVKDHDDEYHKACGKELVDELKRIVNGNEVWKLQLNQLVELWYKEGVLSDVIYSFCVEETK